MGLLFEPLSGLHRHAALREGAGRCRRVRTAAAHVGQGLLAPRSRQVPLGRLTGGEDGLLEGVGSRAVQLQDQGRSRARALRDRWHARRAARANLAPPPLCGSPDDLLTAWPREVDTNTYMRYVACSLQRRRRLSVNRG